MKASTKFAVIAAVALLAIATFNVTGCKQSSTPSTPATPTTNAVSQTVKYTCSMHPEVMLDKPGKCPKCGMELTEKH